MSENNITNPQRIIKETEIRKHFRTKLINRKMQGTNSSEADIIIEHLKINRNKMITYACIASIFYNSKFVNREIMSFRKWLTYFYDLMGIEGGTYYKECKLNISNNLRVEFQYLY